MKKQIKTFLLLVCSAIGIFFICSIPSKAANSDFVIKDHVLVKYTGAGGTVTVPDGVTHIDEWAFEGSGITSIILPDGVQTIGTLAFGNCRNLKTVTMPDSVEIIGDSAFKECTNLEEFQMPANLKKVGMGAFKGCVGFTNVTFPKTVQTIGSDAFSDCTNLKTVTLPEDLRDVDGTAFMNTPWMTELESANPSGVIVINDALFHVDKDMCASDGLEGVHTICPSAFSGNQCLTELVIPDSVTTIGSKAFSGSSLSAITLSDNVTDIKDLTFLGCDKLISVKLPKALKSIGSYAFDSCSALTELTIPDNVTTIEKGAFLRSGLKNIVFPKSVQYIAQDTLSECANLTKVTIQNQKANINNPSNIYHADGGIQTGLGTIFGATINAGEGIPMTDWSSFGTLTIEGYRYSTAEELATCLKPLYKMLGFKKIQFKALDKKTSTLDKVKVTSSFTMAEKQKNTIKITLPKGLKKVTKFTKKSGQVKATYLSSDESIVKVSNKGVVTLSREINYNYPLYVYTILTQPNGNRKVYTTKIIFKNKVALEKVKVTKSLTLSKGKKEKVNVTLPKELLDKSSRAAITYVSSDDKVMKVNSKGVVTLTGKENGKKTLYVYTTVKTKGGHEKRFTTKVTIK